MQLQHSIIVIPPVTPQRIDIFLSTRLRKYSRNKIQNLLFKQAILVNGKPVDADYKIQINDTIEVFNPFREFNANVTPENIPIEIVYEDDSIIVVNKPAGMPVHKGLGNYKGTLLNALAYHFHTTGQNINMDDCSVHRLDSGTSGVIVFAKSKKVKHHLEDQIKNNQMHRTYIALTWGTIAHDEGIIDVPIGRNKQNPMIIQAFPLRDEGKEAVTEYKVLQRFKFATLVECRLQSGRTHQIRIHLQYIGHPVLGDPRYPSNFTFKEITEILTQENISYQLLHAKTLEFIHPETGKACIFEAPAGDMFNKVLGRL